MGVPKTTPEQRRAMVEMIDGGSTYKQAGEAFGVTKQAAIYWYSKAHDPDCSFVTPYKQSQPITCRGCGTVVTIPGKPRQVYCSRTCSNRNRHRKPYADR